MIVAAAVCPQAPALVPAVGFGVAAQLADVRRACLAAVAAVVAAAPDRIVIVGAGLERGQWDESAGGTFRGFGPDVRVGGAHIVLPPSLTVGAWLLDEAGWAGSRTYVVGDWDATDERVGVVVMADGSARHRMLAPEWTDVAGRAFDDAVAAALATGDPDALASLGLDAASEFHASGVDGLVALGRMTKGAPITAHLRFNGAPFDVGYWVADWRVG